MYFVAEKDFENEPKEFRYGVPPELYSEWRKVQKRIGLPQTQILHRLVKFLLQQDELTQGMLLGTLSARPDLIEFALKRHPPHRPGVFPTLAAKKKKDDNHRGEGQ